MVEFIIHFLNTSVLPVVDQIGIWFYILAGLIAFIESTIILGTFIPGTVILLFFGFTASQGDVKLIWVLLAITLGAVLGDFISYAIGRYGTGFIKENKGLLRTSHIDIGKAFFVKHGGKSVILGRFISPIRQVIPFIAGVVFMPQKRFMYLNICGALLWSISYILVGYYFGTNWNLIEKIISRIGIVLTLVLVVGGIYLFNRNRKKRLEALKTDTASIVNTVEPDSVESDIVNIDIV